VIDGDTAESLAARGLEQEHALPVDTLERVVTGPLVLPASPRGAHGVL
jgi:hypothetical protein